MKRTRSRTPSPLPALQPLSFSPVRRNSHSSTPLQRERKWLRYGTSQSNNSNTMNNNGNELVQNEDKELMLALQRMHDKLQASEPAYQDEDVAIIPFPSESNSLSRSPHRTSESEDAFIDNVDQNNCISNNNNNNGISPSKGIVPNQVYECTELSNMPNAEFTTRTEAKCKSATMKRTPRNVHDSKDLNTCSVTSSLLLTSVNLFDACQITRHRRAATNALNMIKQAYALINAQCTQILPSKHTKSFDEDEDNCNDNRKTNEYWQTNRVMYSGKELEHWKRQETWNKDAELCYCSNAYTNWLVCKLHACVQSLLVYANASLPLRFAITSNTHVLLMLCEIGLRALQLSSSEETSCNVCNSTHAFGRNVHVELEQLRLHWHECALSSRLCNYLEQAYVLEFLLDAALPPAVCSTRYEGMHTALLNIKQKIISEFATNKNTNNLLPSITSSSNHNNDKRTSISISHEYNSNNNNNRTVSVSLARVCKCFPLRALSALITMSAFADVKIRVRLLDKLTSEGLLERILHEMRKAVHELHILVTQSKNRELYCTERQTKYKQHDGEENVRITGKEDDVSKIVQSKNGKSKDSARVMQSESEQTNSNASPCRSQSAPTEHGDHNLQTSYNNGSNEQREKLCLFSNLYKDEISERRVAHSLSPKPKLGTRSLLSNKERKSSIRNTSEKALVNKNGMAIKKKLQKSNCLTWTTSENEAAPEGNTVDSTAMPVDCVKQSLSLLYYQQLCYCVDVLLLLSCANLRPACEADELAANAKTASMAVVRPCEWLMHMTEIKAIVEQMVHVLCLCSSSLLAKNNCSSLISQIVECLHQMLGVNECVANIVQEEIIKLMARIQGHDSNFVNKKSRMESKEVSTTNYFVLLSILLPIISEIVLSTQIKESNRMLENNDMYTEHSNWFDTLSSYLPLEYEVERELTRTRHSTIHWGIQLQSKNESLTPLTTSNKCTNCDALNEIQQEEYWWELHLRNNELHKYTRRLSRAEMCVMNDYFDFARHVTPILYSQLSQQYEEFEENGATIVCGDVCKRGIKNQILEDTKKETEQLVFAIHEKLCYRMRCVYVFCSKIAAIASMVLATAHRRQNNLFSAKATNCLCVLSPILERMKIRMNVWQITLKCNASTFVCTPNKVNTLNASRTITKLASRSSDSSVNKMYTPDRVIVSRTSQMLLCTTSEKEGTDNNSTSLSPFISSPTTSLHFEAAMSRSNSEETVGDVLGLIDDEHRTPHSIHGDDNINDCVNKLIVNKTQQKEKQHNIKTSLQEDKKQIEEEPEEEEEEISPQTVTRSWRERLSFHNLFMTRSSTTLTPTQASTSGSRKL